MWIVMWGGGRMRDRERESWMIVGKIVAWNS